MTFDLAGNLTQMDVNELGALQVSLQLEIGNTRGSARTVVLMDYLERVDEEIKSR